MTLDQLRRIGEACYGPEWQTPLAYALGINARTVRRWVAGDTKPSADIQDEIRCILGKHLALASRRQQEIDDLIRELTD